MAGFHDIESFEGTATSPGSDATAAAFRALAMSAMSHGFDFSSMVKDASTAAFGAGALSLMDGADTLASGRIGEPTPKTVLKDGLRALQKGFEFARDAVGVVRDGVTVLEDMMD